MDYDENDRHRQQAAADEGAGEGSPSTSSPSRPGPAAVRLPRWKQKLLLERQEAKQANAALISEQQQREQQAAQRLARLKAKAQRELSRAKFVAVQHRQLEQKRQLVRRMQEEQDRLVGRDVTARLADLPAPDAEALRALSVEFNEALHRHFPPESRSFYLLFKACDIDGSHRISYPELEKLSRGPLRMATKQLPPEKLRQLWKGLDADASGFIDAGELSRFLKLGAREQVAPAVLARARSVAAKAKEAAAVVAETERLQERQVALKAMEVEPASEEEVRQLGDLFAKQLHDLTPSGVSNVIKLFKQMDRDGSGHVTFAEFSSMARHALKVRARAVPDAKLWGLWRAIDDNGNGFICAGEFQRFMRGSYVSEKQLEKQEDRMRQKVEQGEQARKEQARRYSMQVADAKARAADRMEAEAERLEAMLRRAEKQARDLPPPPLAAYEPKAIARRVGKSQSMPSLSSNKRGSAVAQVVSPGGARSPAYGGGAGGDSSEDAAGSSTCHLPPIG
jgi:Ca2+-binding EF-hand superfamily protein